MIAVGHETICSNKIKTCSIIYILAGQAGVASAACAYLHLLHGPIHIFNF